jgi:hypothetical protein
VINDIHIGVRIDFLEPFRRQLFVNRRDDAIVDQLLADLGPVLLRVGLETTEARGLVEVVRDLLREGQRRCQQQSGHCRYDAPFHTFFLLVSQTSYLYGQVQRRL